RVVMAAGRVLTGIEIELHRIEPADPATGAGDLPAIGLSDWRRRNAQDLDGELLARSRAESAEVQRGHLDVIPVGERGIVAGGVGQLPDVRDAGVPGLGAGG